MLFTTFAMYTIWTHHSWNFPMFLLRDGSLTLIWTWLVIFCHSQWRSCLCSYDDLWCGHGHRGEGAMICSLKLSPQGLAECLMNSSSHYNLSHFYLYITLVCDVILVLMDNCGLCWYYLPETLFGPPFYPNSSWNYHLNPLCRVPLCGCSFCCC